MENRKKYTANQNTQPTGSMDRTHGSRLDLVSIWYGPYLGQSAPASAIRSRSAAVHMQGSASSSDEPICALMDSVTSTSSIARVDSPEAMKTVDEGAGQEGVR